MRWMVAVLPVAVVLLLVSQAASSPGTLDNCRLITKG